MLIDWFTVVAQIVNFLVLVLLMKYFLYGRLIRTIDERQKRIVARFAEAEENYKAFLAASKGEFPDDEWKARHRLMAIEPEARGKR